MQMGYLWDRPASPFSFVLVASLFALLVLVVVSLTFLAFGAINKIGGLYSKTKTKTDEDWIKETGEKWPSKRPIDKGLLLGLGMLPQHVPDVLKKLHKAYFSSIGALNFQDVEGLQAKLTDIGLEAATVNQLRDFALQVQNERAAHDRETVSRRLPLLSLADAPKFVEPLARLPTDTDFDFVKPSQFDDMMERMRASMEAVAERQMKFLVCTGPMGVGKTRTGKELLKACRAEKPTWKCGYIPSADRLPIIDDERDLRDIVKCFNVLAVALVEAFYPRGAQLERFSVDAMSVFDKVKLDLGDSVLLQVDELSNNPLAIRLMMKACSRARVESGWRRLNVVVIATGVSSAIDLTVLPDGSRYTICQYTIRPLFQTDLDRDMRVSFMRNIGMNNPENGDQCPRLQNLITDCGGFPASLEMLAKRIMDPTRSYRLQVQEGAYLDVAHAKELYAYILKDIQDRYSERNWANVFLIPHDTERTHISTRTKTILARILLDSLTSVGINPDLPVSSQYPDTTYNIVERGGLISLARKEGENNGSFEVSMPMLAASSLNELVHAVDGDVLKNPFDYGFEIHEELALVSLQALLRQKAAAGIKECMLEDLRPGSYFIKNFGKLVIKIPPKCTYNVVGRLFEDKILQLRMGLEGKGDPPPKAPGTILMAAVGQKAVHGAIVLEGKMSKSRCFVLVLSQSKWSELFHPGSIGPSTKKVQTTSTNEIISYLASMKDAVVSAWLGNAAKGVPIYVLYDVFTDRPERFGIDEIELPHVKCAVSVTTESSMRSVVGNMLNMRSRLKRIKEDEVAASQKRVRKGSF